MQISIFDVVDSQPFNFGDAVRVVNVTEDMDVETYHYLQKFESEKGLVLKAIEQPSLQYEVDFNGKLAIVYHHELELMA